MKKRWKIIIVFVTTVMLCFSGPVKLGNAYTEEIQTKKFDQILRDIYHPKEPGCSVLIAQKRKIIYQKAFGISDMELNIPLRADMLFRIGSITKQFTSIAILQLVEKGKIGLQDDIRKYIKDYPTQGQKITIEHLLTHTSGIKSFTSILSFYDDQSKLDMTPQEVINLFKNEPMDFSPGTKFLYNNSGYFLLGYIIELVTGISYSQYLETNIFKPLGLSNITYDNPNRLIMNRTKGYQINNTGYENGTYMSMTIPYSAGALVSNTEDLFRWNTALFQEKLIKKSTLDLAFKNYKLLDGKETGYGYGWGIGGYNGKKIYSHGGGIVGFFTFSMYIPSEDIFIAVLTNKSSGEPAITAIKLLDILL
jgi:CubicO group peptidase (beta-lactamase class C family)